MLINEELFERVEKSLSKNGTIERFEKITEKSPVE